MKVPGSGISVRSEADLPDTAASMPTRFATPMFWSDEAKSQLKGTEIEGGYISCIMSITYNSDRVGRAEAEALYFEMLQPLIKVRSIDPKCLLIDRPDPTSSIRERNAIRSTPFTCKAPGFSVDHSTYLLRPLREIATPTLPRLMVMKRRMRRSQ